MKLTVLGSNKTELELANGTRVLFSYNTPVAALVNENGAWHQYHTEQKWSRTTSKHINSWNPLGGAYGLRPQTFFNNLTGRE